MARKIDEGSIPSVSGAHVGGAHDPVARSMALPYESDLLTSLLAIVSEWTSASFQEEFARRSGVQLDASAISAVYLLGRRGRLRPSELAAGLKLSAPTASKLISRLSAAGLVSRAANKSDSRSSLVALTAAGSAAAIRLFESGDLMMSDLLSDWSATDVGTLSSLTHRLAETVMSEDRATPGEAAPSPEKPQHTN